MNERMADVLPYMVPVIVCLVVALFIESYYIRQDGTVVQLIYGGITFVYKLLRV